MSVFDVDFRIGRQITVRIVAESLEEAVEIATQYLHVEGIPNEHCIVYEERGSLEGILGIYRHSPMTDLGPPRVNFNNARPEDLE